MADKRDYYEVLGVDKNADAATIKKAYRALGKKYHPDANPGDKEAEAKFKEASEAYGVLSDPEKRRQYDQFGHAAFDGGKIYISINVFKFFHSRRVILWSLFCLGNAEENGCKKYKNKTNFLCTTPTSLCDNFKKI